LTTYQCELNERGYEFRVLVCGGRDYNDGDKVFKTLKDIWFKCKPMSGMVIIHGGAKGADSLAGQFANKAGINNTEFKADWKQYGLKAGYIRNKTMLDEGKPHLVVAFPGGKGTAMMVKLATDAGVEVLNVEA
jgi:hypothetical protein